MNLLLEFILEFFLEGSIEIISNRKISRWIRYPLAILILAFFISILGLILACGITVFSKNKWLALFFILVACVLLVGCIYQLKKYIIKKTTVDK